MPGKTKPILAKAIEITPEALVVVTGTGPVSIRWEKCSERLAHASFLDGAVSADGIQIGVVLDSECG